MTVTLENTALWNEMG